MLRERLAQVIASTGKYTVVHSCSTAVPFGIIRAAGAGGLSFDLSQLRRGEENAVAEAAEAGLGLLDGGRAGLVPEPTSPGPAGARFRPEPQPRVTEAPRPGRRPNGSSGCGGGWVCHWKRARSRP